MNNRLLLTVAVGFLATACAAPGLVSVAGCETYVPSDPCEGNPDVPAVTLNTKTLQANPPNVCAWPGKIIVYQVVPPPDDVGTVAVVPKNGVDTWLTGTNSPDKGKISVTVPLRVPSGTNHDYGVVTSDGRCIDPRVHVK